MTPLGALLNSNTNQHTSVPVVFSLLRFYSAKLVMSSKQSTLRSKAVQKTYHLKRSTLETGKQPACSP
jgi:hypothetical protein